ncbi:hypothetical protein [Yinghuangia seranimata]|uniref:hypothetical protein n=1 Tax=Yinghuangia seranimata TaxID=408067 RepID=UPI00248C8CBA|nr:hypothetical protein [Yinghuangia seranimata]MDI2129830.1 hypothetical protein [Yinghuangia seranimata]
MTDEATTTFHYAIVVADIERFGSRTVAEQAWLRSAMYELLDEAAAAAGAPPGGEPRRVDRGDGVFWLFSADTPKVALAGRFVDRLQNGLRAHARAFPTEERAMRLRVAFHAGEVAWDGRGWVGTDLNTVCRLADIAPLRAALAAGVRSGLAVAATDAWYQGVLRQGDPSADAAPFRPVAFDAKEISGATAWIAVPGYAVPPGIDEFADPAAAGRPEAALTNGAASGAPGEPAPAPGAFAGARITASQVVGGDQIVHGSVTFGQPPQEGA